MLGMDQPEWWLSLDELDLFMMSGDDVFCLFSYRDRVKSTGNLGGSRPAQKTLEVLDAFEVGGCIWGFERALETSPCCCHMGPHVGVFPANPKTGIRSRKRIPNRSKERKRWEKPGAPFTGLGGSQPSP